MRRFVPLALVLGLLGAAPDTPPPPRGFFEESLDAEQKAEREFLALPDPAVARETMRRLAAAPHHLGSPQGAKNAEWILAKLKEWGLEARIETFDVLFPTPKERLLELVEPSTFRASLAETVLKEDPTSGQTAEQLPTYNAYSADGDVTAPLVYVNYGVPDDYERLERLGIDVKGKIVIARYGGGWRGIKPKVAAEKGAVGCIIYSDPKDDGFYEGEVYPKGAFRPEQGVQRGSVADMPVHSGDPLTPGVGATKDARRLELKDAATLTKIPVLPIGYGDAKPLLAALEGPVAPEGWRGALPITYRIGPGPAKVHLRLVFDWKIVPAHNVVARIPGSVWPDEWIVRGNHHDAWVNGAEDPISGLAAMLEEARAYGTMLEKGWRPKRTIILCAWDGEEQGLLGSTEWAEYHREELRRKGVAYINTDGNGRGFLSAGGSHSLEALVTGVASEIQDPEKKMPVLQRAKLRKISRAEKPEDRQKTRERRYLELEALGSGSDYTPFLQHIGLASLHFGYDGESDGGIYHSIYDDFTWYTRFADTDFCLRADARADRGPDDPSAGERRRPAHGFHELFRGGRPLRQGDRRARGQEKAGGRGVEPPRGGKPGLGRRGPEEALRRAEAPSRSAALRPLAAAERLRRADSRGAGLCARLGRGVRARSGAAVAGEARRGQPRAGRVRAEPHLGHRPARPILVPPLRLRSGRLHGLRRQDVAGSARSARRAALGRRQPQRGRDRRRSSRTRPSR